MADTAVELLATDPALTTDAIAAVVIERRQTRAKDPVAAVRAALDADARLERLADGRWVAPVSLLDGAVLTHVLDEEEARAGALILAPDLLPFWRAVVARVPLASGGRVGHRFFDRTLERVDLGMDTAIVGPPGWLPFAVGTFLHVRLSEALLSVAEGPRPRGSSRMAERRLTTSVRHALEHDIPDHIEDQGVDGIARMVFRAVLDAPGLLDDPIRPLGEVLISAGLEVHDDEVGLPGTDWTERGWPDLADGIEDDLDTDEELDIDAELAELREAYDLTDGEVETLRLLLVALTMEAAGAPITDTDTLARLGQLLAQPPIAELIAERAWHDDAVGTLAARILPVAAPDHRNGVRYLLAMAADAGEQPEVAETHLRAGLADDPVFAPSLIALAGLSEDRGRYAEALALLKRAEVPSDDAYRSFLESALRPPGGWPGRNEPCPCGSGRKIKVCHPDGLGVVTLNVGERLIRKLHAWADRPENDERVHTLLDMMGMQEPDADEDDEDPAWWMAHTLAADILLFDRGELDRFLTVRGPLLPPDEMTLAESWRDTRRSLVQVRAIDPGMGVTVLDLVDGSVRHIADRRMSRELDRMDLVCTRVLSDGAGGFISDEAILIPEPGRARVQGLVASGDGTALLAWMIAPSGSEIVH